MKFINGHNIFSHFKQSCSHFCRKEIWIPHAFCTNRTIEYHYGECIFKKKCYVTRTFFVPILSKFSIVHTFKRYFFLTSLWLKQIYKFVMCYSFHSLSNLLWRFNDMLLRYIWFAHPNSEGPLFDSITTKVEDYKTPNAFVFSLFIVKEYCRKNVHLSFWYEDCQIRINLKYYEKVHFICHGKKN